MNSLHNIFGRAGLCQDMMNLWTGELNFSTSTMGASWSGSKRRISCLVIMGRLWCYTLHRVYYFWPLGDSSVHSGKYEPVLRHTWLESFVITGSGWSAGQELVTSAETGVKACGKNTRAARGWGIAVIIWGTSRSLSRNFGHQTWRERWTVFTTALLMKTASYSPPSRWERDIRVNCWPLFWRARARRAAFHCKAWAREHCKASM